MLTRITVCGNPGKWSIFVPGYGDVGIVADYWKHGGPEDCPDTHHDPNLFPGCRRNTKATKLADLLMTTRLAVTADIPLIEGPDGFLKGDKRREYFFLWKIDDVKFDEEGIKFRYLECLSDVGKKHKWQEKKKKTRRGVGKPPGAEKESNRFVGQLGSAPISSRSEGERQKLESLLRVRSRRHAIPLIWSGLVPLADFAASKSKWFRRVLPIERSGAQPTWV